MNPILKLAQQIKDAEGVSLAAVIEKVEQIRASDIKTKEDVKKVAQALVQLKKVVNDIPLDNEVKKLQKAISDASERISSASTKEIASVRTEIKATEARLSKEIADRIPDIITVTEKVTEVAKELDEQEQKKVLDKVLEEDFVAKVRDVIEGFEGDERMDASKLKNLPQMQTLSAGGGSNLSVFKDGNQVSSSTRMNFTGSGVTVSNVGGMTNVAITGGSGASTFLALTDTPADYTSQGGKLVRVNTAEDALEFVAPSTGDGDVVGPASATDNAIARFDATTGKLIQNSIVTVSDTGEIDGATTMNFDTDYTPTGSEPAGTVYWNETDSTLDLKQNGATLQIGQEMNKKVRNATGGTLTEGTVVYENGQLGNRATIAPALADAEATSKITGVLTEDILNNEDGKVTTVGLVRQIKTDYTGTGVWGTTWNQGDLLYVSKTTPGQLTNIEPAVPHHSDLVGKVSIVGAAGIGAIDVQIQRHRTLEALSDVNGTALTTDGQLPVWDNTAGYFDFTSNISDFAPALGADDNYVTDAEKVVIGNTSGTNTGDQTSIVGITGTKAQFDTAVTDGDFMYVGDAPTAHTHLLAAGATDVTATAAEVNVLDGITATTTELNYTDGVTSAIQTQLDAKLTKATNFKTKAITIESPTATEDLSLFFTDDAITITQLNAVSVGTTPSVTYTIRHGTDRSSAGAEVVTGGSTTTSTTTGDEVTSFNDATIVAGSWVWLETTATSGTVTNVNVTIEYTVD